jgi:phosphoglucomutase
MFKDGSRIIFRSSGTSASGAIIRVYFEKFENDPTKLELETQTALKDIISLGLELADIKVVLKKEAPTVIT